MAVFTLEDAQGGVEVIAFPETYQRSASLIETGRLVLVRGKLERDDETARILASEITPIETVRERLAREVAIRVKMPANRDLFEALGQVFSRFGSTVMFVDSAPPWPNVPPPVEKPSP